MKHIWFQLLQVVIAVSAYAEHVEEDVDKSLLNDPLVVYSALGLSCFLLVILIGGGVYFLVYQPKQKRKPLIAAIKIIERGDTTEYPEAEENLDEAIISGLRKKDVIEAYFLMAYVKSVLEKYDEAAAYVLKSNTVLLESLYLHLYIRVQLKEYKKAYDIFMDGGKTLQSYLDTANLASVACLHLGMEHWANRELDAAISYFDIVRKLEVHSALIPQSISNHQITLGLVALYDKHMEEAEKNFHNAIEQSKKDKTSSLEGELGLLLCEWVEQEFPDIDNKLMKLQLASAGVSRASSKVETEKREEENLLMRNVLLWQVISLLFTWLRRERHSGLLSSDLEEIEQRLERIIEIDDTFGDPYLIRGLIFYYFGNEAQKNDAIELLEKSGANVPEVNILKNKEKKNEELKKRNLEQFFVLAQNYLTDRSVPLTLRQELRDRLEKFKKFKTLSKGLLIEGGGDQDGPSMADLQKRGQIIHRKIATIIRPKLQNHSSEDSQILDDLLHEMNDSIKIISNQADKLETTSQRLMVNTSEFLFEEEEPESQEDQIEVVDLNKSITLNF